jgi:hypothetical protein
MISSQNSKILQQFTPLWIPDLLIWLDPNYGLYQEITGASATTPAISSGDPVGTWRARTGQYFITGADSNRPTLQFINNKPVLSFDGSNHYLMCASGPTWTALTHALYAAIRPTTGTDGYDVIMAASQSGNTSFRMLSRVGSTNWGTWGSADYNANTTFSLDTNYIVGMNGGNFRLNGVADGTYSNSAGTGGGAALYIAIDGGSAGRLFTGYIRTLVIHNAVLSDFLRDQLESFLLRWSW